MEEDMRCVSFATAVLIATQMLGPAFAQSISSEIAPTGKLRSAAIAVPVVRAVAEPVGKFIAERLGIPFDSVVYPNPPAYAQSFGRGNGISLSVLGYSRRLTRRTY